MNIYIYQYISVYVYDLVIAARDSNRIMYAIENMYKFKLKGMEPIEFFLGCDLFRDSNSILCFDPQKYIGKMVQNYMNMFVSESKLN